ncbi:hypothetical protein TYRP_022496 [Tyrophagus putrescentiae]|nr:hypothetical protein TYRP_022496 [Tyrophagus putrescentiae]
MVNDLKSPRENHPTEVKQERVMSGEEIGFVKSEDEEEEDEEEMRGVCGTQQQQHQQARSGKPFLVSMRQAMLDSDMRGKSSDRLGRRRSNHIRKGRSEADEEGRRPPEIFAGRRGRRRGGRHLLLNVGNVDERSWR